MPNTWPAIILTPGLASLILLMPIDGRSLLPVPAGIGAVLGGVAAAASEAPPPQAPPPEVALPPGVKAVWDLEKAYRDKTPTRERVCLNGLWRWQPAEELTDSVPADSWGYFKVPGFWPGDSNYIQEDCQTLHVHPNWNDADLRTTTMAWYQREITVPRGWDGRRIWLSAESLHSFAVVCVDGTKAGELRFPAGEVDLTSACRPGRKHILSLLVLAMPLEGVMLSYTDTNAAREVRGSVERRGLCGDIYLTGTPAAVRLRDVKIDTSVRNGQITCHAALDGLAASAPHALRVKISEDGRIVHEFTSKTFQAADLNGGRIAVTEKWKPEKLWDIHTPDNMFDLQVSLVDASGKLLDAFYPIRFGEWDDPYRFFRW